MAACPARHWDTPQPTLLQLQSLDLLKDEPQVPRKARSGLSAGRGGSHHAAGWQSGEECWQAQQWWKAYRSSCSRRGEGLWRILLWASA